jgi:ribose 5-phosphate isomerase A
VPTSEDTTAKAKELGIPLVDLDAVERLDLTIDGADEVDPRFDMIKGGGGAHLREKVIASITRREVIVVGEDKLVDRLNRRFPLPVEVVPFAVAVVRRELERIGARCALRTRDGGASFVTDNRNWILDCKFEDGIAEPAEIDRRIRSMPGVVETGLFVGLAHVLVIGRADGTIEVRERPR